MAANGPNAARPDGDTVARNTAFALAAQLTTALFTAALTIYLVRALGPSGYGVFAIALGISAVLLLPADFGISQSAARFIAERRGYRAEVGAVLASATRLKLLAASVVSLALFGLAGVIADAYGVSELAWPVRGIAVALFGQSLMQLGTTTFVALGRVPMSFRLIFSESAIEFTASVALVAAAGGATAAAFGRAAGYVIGAVIGFALITRVAGRGALGIGKGPRLGVAALGGYAGALVIIDAAFALFNQIDVLLIGAILGPASAGLYSAPLRLITFLSYPGMAAANAVAPRLARHRDRPPDTEMLQGALRYLLIIQAAVIAPILVWADPIADLVLGSEFEESADVLRALTPFIFLAGLGPLVTLAVNYVGEARRRVPIAIATLLINLVIDLLLISKIGIVAGAIGTDVAYTLYVGAHVWICQRLLGLRLRPLGVTLARALPASAGMAAVLLLIGTKELSVLDWAVGAVGGGLALTCMLVATRELSVKGLRRGVRSALSRLHSP